MSAIAVAIPPNGDRAYVLTDTAQAWPDEGAIVQTGEKTTVIGERCAIATRGLSDVSWRAEKALAAYPDYDAKRDAIRDVMTKNYSRELKRAARLKVVRGLGREWATKLADASEAVRPFFGADIVLVGYSQKAKRFQATLSTNQTHGRAPWPFAPTQFERDCLLPFLDDEERICAGYISNQPGSIYRFDWKTMPETLVRLMDAQRKKCLEARRRATTEKEWRAPEIIGGEAVLTTLFANGTVEKKVMHNWNDEIGKPLVEKPDARSA